MIKTEVKENGVIESIAIAKELLGKKESISKNAFSERMKPILRSPESKYFLIRLMDVAFRSNKNKRIAKFVVDLFNRSENYTELLNRGERIMVFLFRTIGFRIPNLSVPAMRFHIRRVTGPILFFIGDRRFTQHAALRKEQGIRLNVNLIGEALVGEAEADERIQRYCMLLRQPEIDYISIKISTLYSQIYPLGYDYTLEQLVEKLSIIYSEVLEEEKRSGVQKFVNLDMEEYRDLHLTMDAFMTTLEQPRFTDIKAGVVLQAYLPDAYSMAKRLSNWAADRCSKGGSAVKVRLVKGANLEMERTESSLENWPLTTYSTKADTDANYKKTLLYLLKPDSSQSLHVGIASHNIFDLAFALYYVKKYSLEALVDFELLEGMAESTVDHLRSQGVSIILYTPIVRTEDYNNAIAYLVRRLDEGSQPGNYLKEGLNLEEGSVQWQKLEEQFRDSIQRISMVSDQPLRNQNRNTEVYQIQQGFDNVANTDWNLKANRTWIQSIKVEWIQKHEAENPMTEASASLYGPKIKLNSWRSTPSWSYPMARREDYEQALSSDSEWYHWTWDKRIYVLRQVAVELAQARGELIAVAVTELGKTVAEVDVEVSEAIDFANYYAYLAQEMVDSGRTIQSKGIQLVLSPWNFPIAIPAGGLLASLAVGKRVILKPSINASACALAICEAMWRAGVPQSALYFLPIEESELDPFLSERSVFDAVILTGGTDTARFLLDRNPRLPLYAETGGKNATIVTSLSDREQAIKNVIQSAFGNLGQKCSATSLLVLEKEVFEDKHFSKLLKDAVLSKIQGDPWDFQVQLGPLAVPISEKIKQVIADTEEDRWLVKPVLNGDFFLSPGVLWDVKKTDTVYLQELFGPILAVMQAEDLDDAIDLVNGLEYGLTSGIESLSPSEIEYWQQRIQAGNLYANRSTTGAIVQRQPFGGMKASSFGLGMKAGGPNYLWQFAEVLDDRNASIEQVRKDYKQYYEFHFSKSIDYVKIRGQHNINHYLKPELVLCLIDGDTSLQDISRVAAAAEIMEIAVKFYALESIKSEVLVEVLDDWLDLAPLLNFNTVIRALNYDRISDDFLKHCHGHAFHVNGRVPSSFGRLELMNYVTEQNMSINYHRYGNLMGEEVWE